MKQDLSSDRKASLICPSYGKIKSVNLPKFTAGVESLTLNQSLEPVAARFETFFFFFFFLRKIKVFALFVVTC